MAVNQLKAGAFLSYVSMGLRNVISLIYTPFMLHVLGQNEYGLYSLAASVVSYLTVLDLGFGSAVVRYTAKFRAEGKIREQYEMFGMFLIIYSIIGLISLIIGSVLYFNIDNLFHATMDANDLYEIRIMMLLMIFNIAFSFPMSVWGSIITAYERFVFPRVVGIIQIILNPVAMVAMLLMGYKAIGIVVITTVFNVITLSINYFYCKHRLHIKILFGHFEWGFFKEVSIYSFWLFLNAIMDRIYWSTGQFILGIFRGATVVAIYAIAVQLEGFYMSFSTAISGVFLPRVTAMATKGNNEKEMSDLFIRTGRIQYVIMAFILIGFIVFGRQFICLWAGTDYEEAYWIALCFFIPLTIPLIQNIGITILQAYNRLAFRSVSYVIVAIVCLGISAILAKSYGGIGCAIGVSISLILGQILIINIYYWKRIHLDIPEFWKEIGKMSIAPICLGFGALCVTYYLALNNWLLLITGIIVFTLIYIPIIWKTTINNHEKDLFARPLISLWQKVKFTDK